MTFNAVEWVRKVRDKNHEKCKNMSPREKIEYAKEKAEEFRSHYTLVGATVDNI